jgi:hypothetical protein
MGNASFRVTRHVKVFVAFLSLLLSMSSGPVLALVTYDGSHGVYSWLSSTSTYTNTSYPTCLSCHTANTSQPATSKPLNTFEGAAPLALSIYSAVTIGRNTSGCMPATGPGFGPPCPVVNNAPLVDTWAHQPEGAIENAAPSISTPVSPNPIANANRHDATLYGEVNANGLDTTYYFEWGLKNGGMTFRYPADNDLSTQDSNGGLTPETVSAFIDGLNCGTEYQFRIRARNADNFPAGSYTDGDTSTFTTLDCNFPSVHFEGSQVTGIGRTITVPINLDGDTLTVYEYPIAIQYQVNGTAPAGDFDLASGTLYLYSPETSGNLTFTILNNTHAPADETVVIDITDATNATVPSVATYTVVITGDDNAPVIPPLQARQAGLNTQYVSKDKGAVTVIANANMDGTGQFSYDWTDTDSRLQGVITGNRFVFDPSTSVVTPGPYVIAVAINDGQKTTHQTITLWINEKAPVLTCNMDMGNVTPDSDADGNGICDQVEGHGDFDFDGIPDYLDPIGDPTLLNTQVTSVGSNSARLITTTAGLSLALDDVAVELLGSGEATGAKIAANNVIDDVGYSVMSGVYDFQIRGLTPVQRTAQVVIPLSKPMPSRARYRKLAYGVWSDFVETSTDRIRSASSDTNTNECPPPEDPAYQNGIIPFNDCLELTLTDGGPNDADGEANGVIRDPGAVAVPTSSSTPTGSSSNSPGGAGALDWSWLVMLAPLLWLRRKSP